MNDLPSPVTESKSWSFYVGEMPASNFYNPFHQVVRVLVKGKYLDFRINPGIENPNYKDHLVLIIAPERVIDFDELHKDRLDLPPGTLDKAGHVATIPQGLCFLIDKRQRINTTAPQNGGAGFAISNTNMFDPEKVVTAITPRFIDRDYTTVDDSGQDPNYGSIGLFINKDGSILIKSTGSSITMGKEGIHLGGRLFQESSAIETGPLSDNSIADLIGSTIPTAGASWPKLPNFGQIANYANAGMKFIQVCDKVKAGAKFAQSVAGVLA